MARAEGRNPGMDVIRCLALFLVNAVHFFLFTGFYKEPVTGKRMLVMVVMRSFCMICVPLFMILSGYLMSRKKLDKAYFRKISHTLGIYLLASVVCTGYRVLLNGEHLSVWQMILGVFSFHNAPYAWYIEMYLGLFLLIPFLNLLYGNIPSVQWKRFLIAVLLLLTALPPVVNVYSLQSGSWWLAPASSKSYDRILPQRWLELYPLTYYFIGCYLREYGAKIKAGVCACLIAAATLLSGVYNIWRSYGTAFQTGAWNDWGSLFQVVLSVLVFVFFMNLEYRKLSGGLRRFLARVSGLCLGGYLVSWMFDNSFYRILNERISYMPWKLPWFFVIVPTVYICSLLVSAVLERVYGLILRLAGKRSGKR